MKKERVIIFILTIVILVFGFVIMNLRSEIRIIDKDIEKAEQQNSVLRLNLEKQLSQDSIRKLFQGSNLQTSQEGDIVTVEKTK